MSKTGARRRLGDRYDGRRVRSLAPMQYVTAFVMKDRCDASNFFKSRVELGVIEDYLRKKHRVEGMKTLGFMHILTAAYVRVTSQLPGINRFCSGQRIYQRGNVVLSMVVKKDNYDINSQDSAIKPVLEPSDTIYQIYEKMEKEISIARSTGDTTNLDNVARAIMRLPTLLLRGFIGLMKCMDYFGVMPRVINRASPFHASIFISNLGSLGIPPIYHHLYNFGNVPLFITFGAKYKENTVARDGSVVEKKYIDYTVVTDERITDGHYFAHAFKLLEYYMRHPWELDAPQENVVEDVK